MKNNRNIIIVIMILVLLISSEPIFAAAGGSIAKAITKSFWGKVLLFILFIIFLPFILRNYVREKLAVRRSMNDLKELSKLNKNFNWLSLKARATDVYTRVQSGWDKNNLEEVSEWMDSWYWQNQKYTHLQNWESQGLKNHVKIKEITKIVPLYVEYNNETNCEDSRVILSITSLMQDFLARISDQLIVEGDKEYKEVESVWTLVLKENKWIVENIEPAYSTLDYSKMKSTVQESLKIQLSKNIS